MVLTAVSVTGNFRSWRAHSEEKVEIWPRIDLLSVSTGAVPISLMMGRQLLCAKYVPSHDDIFRAGEWVAYIHICCLHWRVHFSCRPMYLSVWRVRSIPKNHSIARSVSIFSLFHQSRFYISLFISWFRQTNSLIHIWNETNTSICVIEEKVNVNSFF